MKKNLLILSIIISSISLLFWLLNLNILILNNSLASYFLYNLKHLECDLLFVGFFLFIIYLYKKN